MKNKTLILIPAILLSISSLFAQSNSDECGCPVDNATNAIKFAKLGCETKSPELLIEAALITINSPIRNLTVEKTVVDGKEIDFSSGEYMCPTFELETKALLELAVNYSEGNQDLQAYAKSVMKDYLDNKGKSRGKLGGAAFISRKVNAKGSISDYIYFKGKELAKISITPIGFEKTAVSNVNFYSKYNVVFAVFNSKGEVIGETSNFWGNGTISFTPEKTEVYELRTVNKGDKNVNFIILTN